MASNLSIAQMLIELEGQIKHHREQEEHHAQQEVFHREKRALHAAALATAQESFGAFQAAAAAAGELVERHKSASAPSQPPAEEQELPAGKKRPVGRLVARVVESRQPEETFSPSDIAREVNRRYGTKLRQPLDGRAASVTLRRLATMGKVHIARKGTAHREALYSRSRPARQAR